MIILEYLSFYDCSSSKKNITHIRSLIYLQSNTSHRIFTRMIPDDDSGGFMAKTSKTRRAAKKRVAKSTKGKKKAKK